MFDCLGFNVSDYDASKAFFVKDLPPLGMVIVMGGLMASGWGKTASLRWWGCIRSPASLRIFIWPSPQTLESRSMRSTRAALDAGGKDNGPPGPRRQYHANYYGAFVIAPDGHNVEAVCHKPGA